MYIQEWDNSLMTCVCTLSVWCCRNFVLAALTITYLHYLEKCFLDQNSRKNMHLFLKQKRYYGFFSPCACKDKQCNGLTCSLLNCSYSAGQQALRRHPSTRPSRGSHPVIAQHALYMRRRTFRNSCCHNGMPENMPLYSAYGIVVKSGPDGSQSHSIQFCRRNTQFRLLALIFSM